MSTHLLDHPKGARSCDSLSVLPTLAHGLLLPKLAAVGCVRVAPNFCFKRPAGINISRRDTTFCAVAPVA